MTPELWLALGGLFVSIALITGLGTSAARLFHVDRG